MTRFIILLISTGSVALLLIILGSLVAFKNKITFIAGINKNNLHTIKYPEKLCKLVGISAIIIGLVTASLPIPIYYLGDKFPVFGYFGIVVIIIVFIFVKSRSYVK